MGFASNLDSKNHSLQRRLNLGTREMPSKFLVATICLIGSTLTEAAYLSQANLSSPLFAPSNETTGGSNIGTAEITNTGSDNSVDGVSFSASGWTIASAETGRLAFTLDSSINVPADAPIGIYSSASVTSVNNQIMDEFTIGAGGGLAIGNAANILLQVKLDGDYQLQGSQSGMSLANFNVNAGVIGDFHNVVSFSIGGISSPGADEFHRLWEFIIPVTVGSTFKVEALMSGWLSSTNFEPGESGNNHLFIDPIYRVSNAPGYDLNIVSSAGAPISPIPVPAAVWLFGSGLIGLIGIARNKKS